jgi:hypothetical protein
LSVIYALRPTKNVYKRERFDSYERRVGDRDRDRGRDYKGKIKREDEYSRSHEKGLVISCLHEHKGRGTYRDRSPRTYRKYENVSMSYSDRRDGGKRHVRKSRSRDYEYRGRRYESRERTHSRERPIQRKKHYYNEREYRSRSKSWSRSRKNYKASNKRRGSHAKRYASSSEPYSRTHHHTSHHQSNKHHYQVRLIKINCI